MIAEHQHDSWTQDSRVERLGEVPAHRTVDPPARGAVAYRRRYGYRLRRSRGSRVTATLAANTTAVSCR